MAKKKKILLSCRHDGLIRILTDLWRADYEILADHRWPLWPQFRVGTPAEADIIVSTLFYPDLGPLAETHDGHAPVVAYMTDPFGPPQRADFEKISQNSWFHAVGTENCYPDDVFWPCERFITYACNPARFSPHNGKVPRVLVINKKAENRFQMTQERALGQGRIDKMTPLAEVLRGFSWELARTPSWRGIKTCLADYRVMFNFGCTPYNCVMFEAMRTGIPIVAFPDRWVPHGGIENWPEAKYLYEYSYDIDQLRAWLQKRLNEPPEHIAYTAPTFEEIRQEWIDYFNGIL